jgi:hypothetical protein
LAAATIKLQPQLIIFTKGYQKQINKAFERISFMSFWNLPPKDKDVGDFKNLFPFCHPDLIAHDQQIGRLDCMCILASSLYLKRIV